MKGVVKNLGAGGSNSGKPYEMVERPGSDLRGDDKSEEPAP